jgi:hypothetical protein
MAKAKVKKLIKYLPIFFILMGDLFLAAVWSAKSEKVDHVSAQKQFFDA